MKTKIILTLIFPVLITCNLYSQSSSTPPTDQTINPFWDFYATNYLSGPSAGMGNTGVASDNSISGVSLNPASLNMQENKYQLSVQYTYKTIQPWLQKFEPGINLKQYFLSANVALGYRFNKNFQTGLIYSNPASMYLSEQIPRTNEFGNVIGTYESHQEYAIHSLTIPVIFNLNKIRFGINLNYSIYTNYQEFAAGIITNGNNSASGSFGKFNAQLGLQFRPVENFSFGLTVTPEVRAEFKYKFPSGESDQGERSIYPWKLAAGMEYEFPKSGWRFDVDYNYERTKVLDNLKDRNDINLGAEYTINEKYKVRAGFFTLFDFRNNDINFLDPVGSYNQYFISVGGSMKIKRLQLDLSILDSHISTGIIKNTYVNAGISYNY